MTDKNEPTVEEAREVIEKHDEAVNPKGLTERVDPSSGIRMQPNKGDPSVLTYDGADPEYDEAVRKQAERDRKTEEKKG